MTDGGGLTADLCARALIAAARAAGVNPLAVFEAYQPGVARVRTTAAMALVEGGVVQRRPACRVMHLGLQACTPSGLKASRIEPAAVRKVMDALGLARVLPPLAPPTPAPPVLVFAPRAPAPAAHDLPVATPVQRRPVAASDSVGPLGEQVLAMLDEGAHTTVALSSRIGAKEMTIGMQLSLLRHAGLVEADPLGDGGIRKQLWRRVAAS